MLCRRGPRRLPASRACPYRPSPSWRTSRRRRRSNSSEPAGRPCRDRAWRHRAQRIVVLSEEAIVKTP